ncbi:hypothetical protein ESA94_15195 [Lacibacter luteus]|uniref:M56 family peptidase n=1 Tax=Lacibacter luteus TaxID=2508719 RepID=A0A4Q1CFF9_9BACT|nr:M56 family metallopeptidase [Lacibacter luteus]RXK58734.1 hypothetical protein ESA94_15195 [Lacibacter luteus]
MPVIIEYLLKVSIALALVYVFYQLVLRRLTFYNWNRWYLVGYAALSFFIPFMNITDFLFKHELEEVQFVRMVPVYNLNITATNAGFEWNSWNIAIVLFIAGMMLMGMRMLLQLYSLRKMKAKARLLNEGAIKLFHVEENIMPFSFSNGIYINSKLHTEAELQEIIRHEFVHVKQKHSIDILFAEFLCMVLWFHPAAWFIRKAIRQNLEFIADEKVLQEGVDKKQYQYLLLKVVGNNHYSIASNFNFSSLKNRIIMMNQIKSARVQAIRFLFVLPLVAVLLLAFREVKQKEQRKEEFKQQLLINDTVPASEIASVNVNKNNNEKTVTIVLKNGTKETYNLNNPDEKEAFEKKYGKLDKVVPPPPPPPVPGKVVTVKPAHEDVKLNTKGYFVTIADNMGECVVIVKDKNKKIVEALKLTDWNAAEDKYEAKYGEIAPPPPPSPLAPVTVVGYPSPVSAPAAVTAEGKVATVTVAETTSPVKEVTVTGYKTAAVTTTAVATVNTTAAADPGVVTVVGYGTSTNKPATIKLRGKISTDNVLYILDGKEVTAEEVNQMEPNNIQSISVLKDESAVKLYGEKGKNGVIIITTKTKKVAD